MNAELIDYILDLLNVSGWSFLTVNLTAGRITVTSQHGNEHKNRFGNSGF